jgi:hypothetical protein
MPPTRQAREVFAGLTKLLQVQLDRLAAIEKADLKAFNALSQPLGLLAVEAKTPKLAVGTGRRGGQEESDQGEAEKGDGA